MTFMIVLTAIVTPTMMCAVTWSIGRLDKRMLDTLRKVAERRNDDRMLEYVANVKALIDQIPKAKAQNGG